MAYSHILAHLTPPELFTNVGFRHRFTFDIKKKAPKVFYFVFLELSNFILKRTYAKIMPKTAIL